MDKDIMRQAECIAAAHAAKDTSQEVVQSFVMRCQPHNEHWQFVSTTKYALPGRWVWIVLLCRQVGMASNGLMEVRMKCEMVISEEGEGGKLNYLLKAPFDE